MFCYFHWKESQTHSLKTSAVFGSAYIWQCTLFQTMTVVITAMKPAAVIHAPAPSLNATAAAAFPTTGHVTETMTAATTAMRLTPTALTRVSHAAGQSGCRHVSTSHNTRTECRKAYCKPSSSFVTVKRSKLCELSFINCFIHCSSYVRGYFLFAPYGKTINRLLPIALNNTDLWETLARKKPFLNYLEFVKKHYLM